MGSEWILGRLAGGNGYRWLRIGAIAGCCEYSDEPFCSGTVQLVTSSSPVCLTKYSNVYLSNKFLIRLNPHTFAG
jgi:hypothetical protein